MHEPPSVCSSCWSFWCFGVLDGLFDDRLDALLHYPPDVFYYVFPDGHLDILPNGHL